LTAQSAPAASPAALALATTPQVRRLHEVTLIYPSPGLMTVSSWGPRANNMNTGLRRVSFLQKLCGLSRESLEKSRTVENAPSEGGW
ncbi:MAG: hypothetical protein ACRD3O_10720, partial [Terriglobia bacterium]